VSPDPRAGEITPGSVSSGEEASGVVEIRFDQIVTYADLELRWLEVKDSRCPIGVNCFWEGEVRVVIEAARAEEEGEAPVEFQLTLRAGQKPETASVFGYEMVLVNVVPHPKNGVTPERSDYVADIRISVAASLRLSGPQPSHGPPKSTLRSQLATPPSQSSGLVLPSRDPVFKPARDGRLQIQGSQP
jgi:hypothetical protein